MTVAVTSSMTIFFPVLALLGFSGSFVAGLLGVGGAIVMIPLLLYVPPLLGIGHIGVKAVAGITMVQVFVAAVSGMLAHRRHQAVNGELAYVGGLAMASGSFAGAFVSKYVHEWWLLLVFALMVTAAGLLMGAPVGPTAPMLAEPGRYSRTRAALVSGSVGAAAGLVGAGGAFLLVPLLLVVVRVPIRVTIGSSLAIVSVAAATGVVGKLITGQVPHAPALAVALGAVPGAQLGAAVSQRMAPQHLKLTLAIIIAVIAVRVWADVLRP